MERQGLAPNHAAKMYDDFSDIFTADLGGCIHLGYWDTQDDSPIELAVKRLTGLVADRVGARAGQHLLDIGCGTGQPALQVARDRDARVTGIDISAHEVARANQSAREEDLAMQADFLTADAMNLPFPNAQFDGAWAIEALPHMPDTRATLNEAARVVKPGGRLVIAEMYLRETPRGRNAFVVQALGQIFRAEFALPGQYREDLAATGWQLCDLTDIGDNVRTGYHYISSVFGHHANIAEGTLQQDLRTAADVIKAFAALPEVGYAIIVAERRTYKEKI